MSGSDEESDDGSGGDGRPDRETLVLTTDWRVASDPLRLENPASEREVAEDDLTKRPDKATKATSDVPPSASAEEAPPASGSVSASNDDLVRMVREEVAAAMETDLDDRIRLIVRREVARALAARRRG